MRFFILFVSFPFVVPPFCFWSPFWKSYKNFVSFSTETEEFSYQEIIISRDAFSNLRDNSDPRNYRLPFLRGEFRKLANV